MTAKHTPEPWKTYQEDSDSVHVLSDDYGRIVTLHRAPYDPTDVAANAKHIVSCVNNCQGINPEAVPDLLEVLKRIMPYLINGEIPVLLERHARAAIARATEGER